MPNELAKRLVAEARGVHAPDFGYTYSEHDESGSKPGDACQTCGEDWPCLVERLCRELERAQ